MIFNFDDNKLYYEFFDRHKEKTVVLLHGWGGNHLSLYAILKAFENFNILTLDFWGFGQSDKPKCYYDIYSYSKAVFELIKVLNLNHLTLVGHSFGGRVSIIISAENPEYIDNLILIDSAGIKSRSSIKKCLKKFSYKITKSLVRHQLKNSSALKKFASSDYQKLSRDEQIVFNKIINEDLTKYLKYINNETLLIWGEKDQATPIKDAYKMNYLIKNSGLVIIKNATHFCYMEYPMYFKIILNKYLKGED